jgi:hypothetical protein
VIKSESFVPELTLCDDEIGAEPFLFDQVGVIEHGVAQPRPGADGHGPVQPFVARAPGLEPDVDAEAVPVRIHGIPLRHLGRDIRGAVTEAAGLNINQHPVVGFEGIACVHTGKAVGRNHLQYRCALMRRKSL